jgi:hypothetical protein
MNRELAGCLTYVFLRCNNAQARDNHPDRRADDPEAHAKFQIIGQAYQVRLLECNNLYCGRTRITCLIRTITLHLFKRSFGSICSVFVCSLPQCRLWFVVHGS